MVKCRVDVVKAMDVPIGGYIYPKADLSEKFILNLGIPNGTTSIITYKIKEEEQGETQEYSRGENNCANRCFRT